MYQKFTILAALAALALSPIGGAQTTQVDSQYLDDTDFINPPTNPLLDELGTALWAGTNAVGDGDIFQIGYFDGVGTGVDVATFGASEWGSFTPLTSTGGRHLTTIGDAGGVSGNMGVYSVSIIFDPALDPELPPAYPARLGVRFFNDLTLGTSSHYNTATSNGSGWLISAPNLPPPIPSFMDLDNPGGNPFAWESGGVGTFQTSLLIVPEPSVFALLLLGGLSCLLPRRRPRRPC